MLAAHLLPSPATFSPPLKIGDHTRPDYTELTQQPKNYQHEDYHWMTSSCYTAFIYLLHACLKLDKPTALKSCNQHTTTDTTTEHIWNQQLKPRLIIKTSKNLNISILLYKNIIMFIFKLSFILSVKLKYY